ncbi:hypothetical protein [Parasutterella excrementihominis]|uniref:hypothetical protein n=1 Tax=Parasutterella excrementihominis TaxID=487175 RepID=UPI003A934053
MAVQNIPRKVGPMTGNGVLKEFPFSFKAVRPSDIVVKVSSGNDITAEETTLAYGTDYTVALNDNQDESAGGSVTFTEAPAVGTRIAITSDTAIDQQLVLTNHDGFLPESLNEAYDKLTIICQELKETLGRCLIVPITSEKTPQEVMTDLLDVANKAADYAQRAEAIYNEVTSTGLYVSSTWQEIQETKAQIDIHKAAIDAAVARAEVILARNEVIGAEVDALVPHLPDLQINRQHIDDIHRVGSDLRGFETETLDLGSITDTDIDGETKVEDGYIKKVADHIDDCIHPVGDNIEKVKAVNANLDDVKTVAEDLSSEPSNIKKVAQATDDITALSPKVEAIQTVAENLEAVESAASVATNLESIKQTVLQSNAEAGFSFRYMVEASSGMTVSKEAISPSVNIKVGDHVVNRIGDYFRITAVTETTATLSPKQGSFKGEKGDKGDGIQPDAVVVNAESLPAEGTVGQLVLAGMNLYTWVAATDTEEAHWENMGELVGPKGDTGPTPEISVEATSLSEGASATVTKTGTSEAPVFTFGIPKGDTGSKGDTGTTPEISISIQMLDSNSEPSVEKTGTDEAPSFLLKIPRGLTGATGTMPDTVDLGGLS